MLHRDILIAQRLRLILCVDQHLIQVLSDKYLSAADLHAGRQLTFRIVLKMCQLNLHLLDQLRDQSIRLLQKRHQKVLLLDLLISVFISQFLAVVDCFHGFLCEFLNVHKSSSFHDLFMKDDKSAAPIALHVVRLGRAKVASDSSSFQN